MEAFISRHPDLPVIVILAGILAAGFFIFGVWMVKTFKYARQARTWQRDYFALYADVPPGEVQTPVYMRLQWVREAFMTHCEGKPQEQWPSVQTAFSADVNGRYSAYIAALMIKRRCAMREAR